MSVTPPRIFAWLAALLLPAAGQATPATPPASAPASLSPPPLTQPTLPPAPPQSLPEIIIPAGQSLTIIQGPGTIPPVGGESAPAAAAPPALPTVAGAAAELRKGEYEAARALAEAGRKEDMFETEYWRLEAQALLATGRYEEAYQALRQGLQYDRLNLKTLLLLREACLYTGRDAEAQAILQQCLNVIASASGTSRAQDREFLVAAGRVSLLVEAEPRLVLENLLRRGTQGNPRIRDAYLAIGGLALEKRDFAMASRTYGEGLRAFPDDPDLLWGMAASFKPSDREEMLSYALRALAQNPRHVPTLLLLSEHLLDAEEYVNAKEQLNQILKINPRDQLALALLSALATLQNQPAQAAEFRRQALETWAKNPRVDYLLGQKLSQNYRFADGAAAQQRALASDPYFTPARIQLAQDMLRLGRDEEGWSLASDAHVADAFNVEAFNLVTLRDQLRQSFTTLENPHFKLRMSKAEAPVYGARAMALLEKARADLNAKYGVTLDQPVSVEIYPDPKDFSVRTFGMPQIGGFLGVTFGPVVTINSPAAQLSNWEDVLWHEYVHVLTLALTKNKMPRWLSEGLSVYEEWQAKKSWGMRMTPEYRTRLLEGKMQPISAMSAAFLKVENPEDIQFAYFESALVVQYLIERYGFEKMKTLLRDLGAGLNINDALAKNYAPLPELDAQFAAHARELAVKTAGGLDFTRPAPVDLAALLGGETPPAPAGPNNYYTVVSELQQLAAAGEWAQVKEKVTALNATGLYVPGGENFYLLLAAAERQLGNRAGEQAALTVVAEHEGDLLDPVSRLLALAEEERDWPAVARWSDAWLAINPLAPSPWRSLLTARENTGDSAGAIAAATTLLALDPPDLASINYRLAKLLKERDPERARRHVLQALEEAPRFRAAYELLAALPPPAAAAANP